MESIIDLLDYAHLKDQVQIFRKIENLEIIEKLFD
jgi:hypothetical protein